MNNARYLYSLLLVTFMFFLSSCSNKNNGLKEYEKCLDSLNNNINYTVSEITDGKSNTYEFSNGLVHFYNQNEDIYYYVKNNKRYSLCFQKESNDYIEKKIDSIEAFSFIDRFNNILKYVENNCFEYKDGEYESISIDDCYVYRNKTHYPLRIEMALSNDNLYYFYEHYTIDGIQHTDVMYITKYGMTNIELPQEIKMD